MNIELEEVVQDVSDDALEMAAGGAQGGQHCFYGGAHRWTGFLDCFGWSGH